MNTFAMYKALLHAQWKHQRVEITALTLAAAVACPAAVWMRTNFGTNYGAWPLIDAGTPIAVLGSIVAILGGFILSIRPYLLDAQAKHTYALQLPVPRSHYALLRAADGLTLVLLPVTAFLIGALIAAQALPPDGLIRAFPIQLSVRFLLATCFAFAVGFGLQYGLGKRATRLITIAVLTVIGTELLAALVLHASITAGLWELLRLNGSPIKVFLSSWTLFNV